MYNSILARSIKNKMKYVYNFLKVGRPATSLAGLP